MMHYGAALGMVVGVGVGVSKMPCGCSEAEGSFKISQMDVLTGRIEWISLGSVNKAVGT